ncbi:DUF1287 domain-containing protein [Hyphomicrobium sp.]|uniref:DUF1287 domain-containing protein n=1 Tax=Hyphomicrobium sp. TaxID=82 RepID=UPI003F6E6647
MSGLAASLRDATNDVTNKAKTLRFDDVRCGAALLWSDAKSSAARHSGSLLAHCARLAEVAAPRERFDRIRAGARSFAQAYGHDERQAFALLMLPFLLVASAIVVHQSVRSLHAYMTLAGIRTPDTVLAPVLPPAPPLRLAAETAPRLSAREAVAQRVALSPVAGGRVTLAPTHASPRPLTEPRLLPRATEVPPGAALLSQFAEATIPAVSKPERTSTPSSTKLALLAPFAAIDRNARPSAVDSMAAMDTDEHGIPIRPGICTTDDVPRPISASFTAASPASLSDEAFGLELAKAAQSQVGKFVIYNDAYRSISYPMGDVNDLFGVCTDVVVRAYRALGIDLQALVHQARAGSGDTNIDHRRTEVLRRFFAAKGESLPPSAFAEDYRPGDIVTYYRPQNRGARAHIAMVSSVVAPSGRPMIVHNRGWGPQLEDALFVDEITGHYRYRSAPPTRDAGVKDGGKRLAVRATESAPASTVLSVRFPGP